jgi:hypothetical protein
MRAAVIAYWLIARGYPNADLPIFTVLYIHNTRYKFTTNAIYKIVLGAFKKVGVKNLYLLSKSDIRRLQGYWMQLTGILER